MTQELKSNLLLNIKPKLLHYTQKRQTHGYGWSSLLSRTAFCRPYQTIKVRYI